MRIIVQTNSGDTVAVWSDNQPVVRDYWYGPAPASIAMLTASCPGNRAGSSFISLLRGAMGDAEVIERGGDPERPSEKAMRLSQ